MGILEMIYKNYPISLLKAWMGGNDYSMINSSHASKYLKDILVYKAMNRNKKKPSSWFFGESYIASTTDMTEGWYNSFKWLTSDQWITGKGLESKFKKPFYNTLMTYIGPQLVENLQQKTSILFDNYKEKFYDPRENKYHKPVAPDLWLICKDGQYRFIESKLQTDNYADTAKPHQIAGLALIKKYLKVSNPVSVSIMYLYARGSEPIKDDGIERSFNEFYDIS